MDASIEDNMTLVAAPKFKRGLLSFIDKQSTSLEVATHREAVQLTPEARNDQAVKTLSGGNQQKVVLAKWLSMQPKVIIFDEPTRGIDVGSKNEIYRFMRQLADSGVAVLMISSDMEEVIGVSDRIAVMHRGRLSGFLGREKFSEQNVLTLAIGGHLEGAEAC